MSSTSSPDVVEDCRGVLRILSDGSILRSSSPPAFPFPVRDDADVPVDWKEVSFSSSGADDDLRLRLYRPRPLPPGAKFPVVYYFHGGGFCIGSCAWPNFHNCCLRLASELSAFVVSPDYRLAPEHRLPAAFDDATAALLWLQPLADPWIAESADLACVFVSGESAGGSIAHHLAVRFGSPAGRAELGAVRVRGFLLLMPAFGGTVRTRSEAECPSDAVLTTELTDRYWRLALPAGATTDHPVANPFGPGAPSLEAADLDPMLVAVAELDLLRDRALDYASRLKGWGKTVEVMEAKGQQHAFFGLNPWSEPVTELIEVVRHFMDKYRY
ncbi:putative carboxylesterase 15 [Canna indica]|uniref:Carboxylesterase 15 n=1 Tax=Canna indica TaxID=4628 RepID=A0AAQ3KUM2_9LILI|nr:putative carboxylesterase 15 [Canna indica]